MTDAAHRRVADLRRHYRLAGLDEHDLADHPMAQFDRWFAEAVDCMHEVELPEPNAMVVATADLDGRPSTRMVLLKGYDDQGFVFYTNYHSRKGRELEANPWASLHFGWLVLQRQVIVVGRAQRVSREQTEAYFESRPLGSRLGAWASPQSTVVSGREELDERYAEVEQRFAGRDDVPPPDHWGGVLVQPETVEFWQGRPDRMHDRLRYRHTENGWVVERLAP